MPNEKFDIKLGDEYAKQVAIYEQQNNGIEEALFEALERLGRR